MVPGKALEIASANSRPNRSNVSFLLGGGEQNVINISIGERWPPGQGALVHGNYKYHINSVPSSMSNAIVLAVWWALWQTKGNFYGLYFIQGNNIGRPSKKCEITK